MRGHRTRQVWLSGRTELLPVVCVAARARDGATPSSEAALSPFGTRPEAGVRRRRTQVVAKPRPLSSRNGASGDSCAQSIPSLESRSSFSGFCSASRSRWASASSSVGVPIWRCDVSAAQVAFARSPGRSVRVPSPDSSAPELRPALESLGWRYFCRRSVSIHVRADVVSLSLSTLGSVASSSGRASRD
jgi:hypothetical protein